MSGPAGGGALVAPARGVAAVSALGLLLWALQAQRSVAAASSAGGRGGRRRGAKKGSAAAGAGPTASKKKKADSADLLAPRSGPVGSGGVWGLLREVFQPRRGSLNVFDFDGTLFRSPMPNGDLWTARLVGVLRSPPRKLGSGKEKGGLGWFQDVSTLSPPAVPAGDVAELLAGDWLVPETVAAVRASMADPEATTVLLTGRTEDYRAVVERLVTLAGLEFDEVGLKPLEGGQSTLEHKVAWVDAREAVLRPRHVSLWEDRAPHAESFAKARTHWTVHKVPEEKSIIPPAVEVPLVQALVARYLPERSLIEARPARTGAVVVDPNARNPGGCSRLLIRLANAASTDWRLELGLNDGLLPLKGGSSHLPAALLAASTGARVALRALARAETKDGVYLRLRLIPVLASIGPDDGGADEEASAAAAQAAASAAAEQAAALEPILNAVDTTTPTTTDGAAAAAAAAAGPPEASSGGKEEVVEKAVAPESRSPLAEAVEVDVLVASSKTHHPGKTREEVAAEAWVAYADGARDTRATGHVRWWWRADLSPSASEDDPAAVGRRGNKGGAAGAAAAGGGRANKLPSLGEVVRRLRPELTGRDIGACIQAAKTFCTENRITTGGDTEALDEFVRDWKKEGEDDK